MGIHVEDEEEERTGRIAQALEPVPGEPGHGGASRGLGGGVPAGGLWREGDGIVVVVLEAAGEAETAVGHGVGGEADGLVAGLAERLGDQKYLLDALSEDNPLPDAFEVTVTTPSVVESAAGAIAAMQGVEEAKYGQDVVEHLFDITRLMRIFGFVLMGLLGGATLFIISNTIRLTVFARRKEIAIMKYVGATDWFIRWPFLLEGIVLGCIGGFIAAVALRSFYAAMAAKIYSTLAFFPLMPQYPFMNYVTLAILLAGIVIGAIGSVISLKRFLRV